jgi:hypothetical protein
MELESWRKTMSKEEMEKMLDEVFRKVFGELW